VEECDLRFSEAEQVGICGVVGGGGGGGGGGEEGGEEGMVRRGGEGEEGRGM